MAKPLSTTSYAVLGLLFVRPWTTYELAKQVQRSLDWFWPRAERKLYDEPKLLVDAGFATAETIHTGRRASTVYTITPAGRSALQSWLGQAPAPPALEFEGMVKVFFADGGTLAQLRATLERIESDANDRLAALRTMIEANREATYEFSGRRAINALGLRFELDHLALQATWAAWAREQVGGWRTPTDACGWDWEGALDR